MTFIQSIQSAYKKYAVIDGRATRSEYWWFFLYFVAFAFSASMLSSIPFIGGIIYVIINVVLWASLIPLWAVTIRRLHDVDLSGLWILLPIVNLYYLQLPSNPSQNQYDEIIKNDDYDTDNSIENNSEIESNNPVEKPSDIVMEGNEATIHDDSLPNQKTLDEKKISPKFKSILKRIGFWFGIVTIMATIGLGVTYYKFEYYPENISKDTFDAIKYEKEGYKERAFKIFTRACENNDQLACASVATYYLEDNSKRYNPTTAFQMYKQACENGIDFACENVAWSKHEGIGTRKDPKVATEIFKKYCDLNSSYSCYWLGKSYGYGIGVPYSLTKSIEFYGKACDLGDNDSCEAYNQLIARKDAIHPK